MRASHLGRCNIWIVLVEDLDMTAIPHQPSEAAGSAGAVLSHHGAVYEAYRILQFGFIILPIAAGADKFAGILTQWT